MKSNTPETCKKASISILLVDKVFQAMTKKDRERMTLHCSGDNPKRRDDKY